MLILNTPRLLIRNWRDDDRDLFHEINSDPVVMEYFPHLRSRAESDALLDFIRDGIRERGLGFYALAHADTDEPIGFCGLAPVTVEGIFPDGAIEIGWRLAHRHWGKGYVTEAGRALLRHGFETHGLDEIVSFAVMNNRRSTAVMERIGLKRQPERDFDSPRIPDAMPHLKRHALYALTAEEWRVDPPSP
jgi:RimJ/RimL family protein N-acetyltransferase